MADVDLYGADAGRIRNQYQTSLGRGASDDEVTGWLSGSYGGGSIDNWLQQIDTSHEAQQRRQPRIVGQPGPDINTKLDPPQNPPAQTTGATSIFDPEYRRTGFGTPESGYGPGGVNNPAYTGVGSPTWQHNQSGYQDLNYWQQQGVPYTEIFDLATGQIKPGWQRTGKGYERVQGRAGGGGTPQAGNYQSWFLSRMGNGASSPEALAAMEAELNRYGIRLQKDSYGTIRGRMYLPDGSAVDVVESNGWGRPWTWINRGTGGGGHAGGGGGVQLPGSQYSDPHTKLLEELTLARINALQGGQDPNFQRLMQYFEQRFNDLQGPGRTGAENEVIRTQALDPIERDRSAAKKRVMDRIGALGYTPESGIAQQLLRDVDNAFDEMRATTQNVMAADELNRREGRNQRAEGLASSLYELPQAREREAIGYAGALSDLGPQRLQLAMQAAGLSDGYGPMANTLLGMANLNQNAALLNQRNSADWMRELGSTLYWLSRAGQGG